MKRNRNSEVFREEAYELLEELESALLALEETPNDAELIGRVFRAMHTIKGSGGMFGFDEITDFTHEVETVFDLARDGKIEVTKELIDLTLAARDQIRIMLEAAEGGPVDDTEAAQIITSLRGLLPKSFGEERRIHASTVSKEPPPPSSNRIGITYRIRFRPAPDILSRGINPVLLLDELRELGQCRVVAQTYTIPCLGDLDPEVCYTYWDIILTTDRGVEAVRDVFIFVEDESELCFDVIDEGRSLDEADYKKLGDILIERGDLSPEDLRRVLLDQRRIGEMLVDAGVVDGGRVESALAEQELIRRARRMRQVAESTSSIRVNSSKLDTLVDLVAELVTVQARLSQTAASRNDSELTSIAEEVEHLAEELRGNTMSIRMMPIGTIFGKFRRLVRDLSQELGKEVEMVADGAETELDKTVIEHLSNPLVHLIRNSIDHGIEPPDNREAAGKSRKGTVSLSAMHSGANVFITIADDGAGLDAEAILAKALKKEIIPPDAELSEKETYQLILVPGFSTAKEVSSLSGRGVGMDVVKRSIEALRGSVEIASTKDVGTTITLKLPLTLAIIEGLLVKLGMEHFVLPLSAVEECVELTREDITKAHGRHLARVRDEIVPYIPLRERFAIYGVPPETEQIVITRVDCVRVGFVVDKVIGEHQTVIKSLGRFYRDVEGISGATILGDGTIALILDVPQLFESAWREETGLKEKNGAFASAHCPS